MSEIIKFLAENGLNEVIKDQPCNYFLAKDEEIELVEAPNEVKNIAVRAKEEAIIKTQIHPQIKPVFSTSHALSLLAKKSQENNLAASNMDNQNQSFSLSINDIVQKAKDLATGATNLSELKKVVENFDGCNLKKMATNTVFSDGNPDSKIMLIGEAPGNNEDLQGIPFCGDSGKLLDEMFKAIKLTRNELYITNTIFWRPPGNRRPTPEELAICRPFVERHIQLINPKLIVLIGATAMSSIINNNEPISKIRGKFIDFAPDYLDHQIKLVVIFHPSYLLRQANKKKIAWLDMLKIDEFVNRI